jgi:hypothetical protein
MGPGGAAFGKCFASVRLGRGSTAPWLLEWTPRSTRASISGANGLWRRTRHALRGTSLRARTRAARWFPFGDSAARTGPRGFRTWVLLAISGFAADVVPSSDGILARVETEYNRRHILLKEYSGSRQYTLQTSAFCKQAAVAVLMNYRQLEGERYTIVTRSGSDKLNGIIDKVLLSKAGASMAPEKPAIRESRQTTGRGCSERKSRRGRNCYVLELARRTKSRYLTGRLTPDREEFVEVHGFWLPGHVRSVPPVSAWPHRVEDSLFQLPDRGRSGAASSPTARQNHLTARRQMTVGGHSAELLFSPNLHRNTPQANRLNKSPGRCDPCIR